MSVRVEHYATAGPCDIYSMKPAQRLLCYDSYTDSPDIKDLLGRWAYSYTTLALGLRFYIPEDRVCLALLADSTLTARPNLDLYL